MNPADPALKRQPPIQTPIDGFPGRIVSSSSFRFFLNERPREEWAQETPSVREPIGRMFWGEERVLDISNVVSAKWRPIPTRITIRGPDRNR